MWTFFVTGQTKYFFTMDGTYEDAKLTARYLQKNLGMGFGAVKFMLTKNVGKSDRRVFDWTFCAPGFKETYRCTYKEACAAANMLRATLGLSFEDVKFGTRLLMPEN